uniref:thiosulfate sulfurtransferase/rhodanese-like domain-containing protein 3 n=1 Tax=Ciona intestinalis TaxID=7719 RepID=UPI0002B8DB75|nr:thiosulfate sulfurtransferase/rhodanese-like domain-containing protein 3 [Ciona intestinalis]|eukprot:XP_004226969.1 thiosulfate sulfurtransferase/rhodanese-like domain-containing protein 3 [Ciona intestinalis]
MSRLVTSLFRNGLHKQTGNRVRRVCVYKYKPVTPGVSLWVRTFSGLPDVDYTPAYVISDDDFVAALKKDDYVIIDVRTPKEIEEGKISSKVWLNIPYDEVAGALNLPDDKFKLKFGINKPGKNDKMAFYCLGGMRSTAALYSAQELGFKRCKHFPGGWEQWLEWGKV